jgi:Ca2+/Na+ antiporter
MLGLTVLLFPIMLTGLRVNRFEGCLLLTAYGIYLTVLLRGQQ